MKSLRNIVHKYDPEIKDTINWLTLESFKEHYKLKDTIEYLNKDLYSLLFNYYPSLEWKFQCQFNLHPIYEKYIWIIMKNNFYIHLIVESIKNYFKQNPEEFLSELVFHTHCKWIDFSVPINSTCWVHYHNSTYIFHNPDSEYIINFFTKIFKIYIKTVYEIILKISKWEKFPWEKEFKWGIGSHILKLK